MKGSQWNKWDLHIHSPMTWLANNYTPDDIDGYVRKLGEQQLSLVAVTNYFYFKQNELETIRDEISRQGLEITVLGNVEFRIDQQNKNNEWINVHILFSDKLSTERINDTLSRLPLKLTDGDRKTIYCCERSVKESGHGVDTIMVDFSQLLDHLNATLSPCQDYLVAVCPNGYGGYRPDATGRSQAAATEIDRQGQIIFGGLRDRDYFLRTDRYEGASIRPVFQCSDAHCTEHIGRGFSWVKALPTFEGLRQAMLEPEGRLALDLVSPALQLPKVHFSRLDVEGSIFNGQSICFRKLSIPLNPDMVAIIGGRGTGKSLLLDAVRSQFAGAASRGSEIRDVNVQHLTVELDKANGEKVLFECRNEGYEYLHVSQGEIKLICQQPGLISDEIKKMLRLSMEDIPEELREELVANLGDYRAFREYHSFRDEQQQPVNTEGYHLGMMKAAQDKINTLTSAKNKLLIEQFQANSTRSMALTKALASARLLFRELAEAETSLNTRIQEVNGSSTNAMPIPSLDLSSHKTSVSAHIAVLEKQSGQLEEENKGIIFSFREQGIEQDISGVLEKIRGYQEQIQHAILRQGEIQQRVQQAKLGTELRATLATDFVHHLLGKKERIDRTFASLTDKEHLTPPQQELIREILTDIRIFGQPHFDIHSFYSGMLERLNRGKFRVSGELSAEEKLRTVFGVSSIKDFQALIAGQEMITLPEKPDEKITIETFMWKSEYFNSQGPFALLAFLFSPEHISTYLTVRAEFEYKGKTVEKLSAGQRGTFYVCLKLATDTFGSPFVFDQPEDDLDNDFIMHNLVPLFRKIKQYRQVIIVTHNANLVVNCDAEQVIIASNTDEVISYRSGALEYGDHGKANSIRKAICDVLEGGRAAFEAREQKYGMPWLSSL
ncbi:TrlF family AAA-like ATPase [Citrobacter freundii]|uniref:TrlF family AAA-like ATPase n=1 Tax=Citrobacter TaxID=544 RepID=UPI002578B94A|nr:MULTISPECIES: DNA repair protein [Citrobacter]MDM3091125.1 DNA repair protein [Citrobacter sp. Cf133]MDT7441954.1 DNA repair protein [Citrobacter freundii]MDT9380772.1 DNA repair protein [Citrobacter freundii]HDX5106974.1 AAA family ATPase [Citrobacter freundii]